MSQKIHKFRVLPYVRDQTLMSNVCRLGRRLSVSLVRAAGASMGRSVGVLRCAATLQVRCES